MKYEKRPETRQYSAMHDDGTAQSLHNEITHLSVRLIHLRVDQLRTYAFDDPPLNLGLVSGAAAVLCPTRRREIRHGRRSSMHFTHLPGSRPRNLRLKLCHFACIFDFEPRDLRPEARGCRQFSSSLNWRGRYSPILTNVHSLGADRERKKALSAER